MTIPVKLTRAHQVTLPKRLLERAGWLNQEFFTAQLEKNRLILKPLTLESRTPLASLEDLRQHFARMGITEREVREAVTWARSKEQSFRQKRRAMR